MSSVYPDCWKIARVVPVPKVKNPRNPVDFRPVSILQLHSKVLEILIGEQIMASTNFTQNLSKFQSGFRKHHSTTTLMSNLVDEIRMNVDKKFVSILVSLDLSRAFESVCYEVLLNKLFSLFSFSRSACALVASFLFGRKQFLQFGSNISMTRAVVEPFRRDMC